MRAEILTIGSELTSGATVNTNAAYLARKLAELGVPCQRQVAVGDDAPSIRRAVIDTLPQCELVVVTGGLGPTFDDLTMQVIAETTGRSLRYAPGVAAGIRRFYSRGHRRLQQAALRQACVPRGGIALPNPLGTAPGLWLSLGPCILVALPGVPAEMRAIMERSVVPRLKRLTRSMAIESRTVRTAGVVELSIQMALRRLRLPPNLQIGLYPHLRMVDIRLTAATRSRAAARSLLSRGEARLRRALGVAVYGTDEDTLESVVGALLVRRGKTLAVAESCTGGGLSDRLTNVPGSSRYLRGSVVAYHNGIKQRRLSVPEGWLKRFGAVSAPVASAMAAGVRDFAEADIGLAITGIAGPTGGSRHKPVGLVYLALADVRGSRTQRCQFFGDRAAVKAQAAQAALDWLRRYLISASA